MQNANHTSACVRNDISSPIMCHLENEDISANQTMLCVLDEKS